MRNLPSTSVVTIVYNGERYLKEAIDSILCQTYGSFEYIIVDNNSTDSTPIILEQYRQKDQRIKVIREQKQGILFARNAGLRAARGEWIAVLDSDDVALENRLERQLSYLRSNPSVILVGSGCIMIDQDGKVLKEYRYPENHESLVRRLESNQAFFAQSSAMMRRSSVMQLHEYRFSSAEDYDLWLRLCAIGRIACIDDPLIMLRRYVKSNSYRIDQKEYVLTKVISLICYLRKKEGLSDLFMDGNKEWRDFKEWIRNKMELKNVFKNAEAMREINRLRYNMEGKNFDTLYGFLKIIAINPSVFKAALNRYYLRDIAEQIVEDSKSVFSN
jgi:glycosyltransferase involved in cell wall biosynthesis